MVAIGRCKDTHPEPLEALENLPDQPEGSPLHLVAPDLRQVLDRPREAVDRYVIGVTGLEPLCGVGERVLLELQLPCPAGRRVPTEVRRLEFLEVLAGAVE